MKTLTGAIALILALLFGASHVAVAAEQKSQPTGGETKQPATGERGVKLDKPVLQRMTGKVIRDNQSGKTFTVMAKGKEGTFSAANLKVLPKVGAIIDITYTENPGGPMEATTINTSKSNTY